MLIFQVDYFFGASIVNLKAGTTLLLTLEGYFNKISLFICYRRDLQLSDQHHLKRVSSVTCN